MAKLKALLLTEGYHGMISQVEGLAKALKAEFQHKIVRLNLMWNYIPPKLTPISKIILKDKNYINNDDTFDLVISCGRKSVVPSIIFKKKNDKIFTIHIQDPKVSFKNFDLIVAPEHDNLVGENSPNKYYNFSNEELAKIFNKVRSNFISIGYKIIIIPSMRTPKRIIDLANKEFLSDGYVVNSVDKQAYLASLALANKIVVTCDSTSMISEAAASGKPIFVAHMQPKMNNYRFERIE